MHLVITHESQVKDIQKQFNMMYPFLWIDFFYNSNGTTSEIRLKKIDSESRIKDVCRLDGCGAVDIGGKRTVSQVEKDLLEITQLKVKLLRKSGNVWVNPSYTGNWTLDRQNDEGKQIILD